MRGGGSTSTSSQTAPTPHHSPTSEPYVTTASNFYRGRWHTLIALTTAGKTTFALWQVKSVLEWGGHVVYIHFEEASPSGIIYRLTGLGVNIEVIRKQLHWGTSTPMEMGRTSSRDRTTGTAPTRCSTA